MDSGAKVKKECLVEAGIRRHSTENIEIANRKPGAINGVAVVAIEDIRTTVPVDLVDIR